VLNILQQEALEELRRARALRQTKGLVILPPSSGKTRIAALDAQSAAAERILYVAHTHEILDVALSEFSAVFGRASVAHLHDGQRSPATRVSLATIQYLTTNIEKIRKNAFDYVVVDEFHHAAAPTYRKLVNGLKYSFLLGLTATPFRADRQDIAALCDGNIIVQYELRSGVESGILTPYHYFGCFDDIDYHDLPIGYGVKDLERKLIIKERHEAVIRKWEERAEGKPTLAFCCSHVHARRVAAAFSSAGIPSATYLSITDPAGRAKLIQNLLRGNLKGLCVVDILNEGADLPFVECLLFLRPTESKRVFLQQLGRGLRKYVGKSHCTVVDFIGNFRNAYKIVEYHGLRPDEYDQVAISTRRADTLKSVLDIPIGCKVAFEDRVLDIFSEQTLDPRNATRGNIGRILVHRYRRLSERLGRPPNRRDIDRNDILNSTFYTRVFGSWDKFIALIQQ
jgi:superfamily II DNA or RNA helicase